MQIKIVGLTVQEIEGYKSFSIKQSTSIMINFLCCPLLGRSIFFIGILVYYNTKLVTLFFPEHTISIGLSTVAESSIISCPIVSPTTNTNSDNKPTF